VGSFLIFVITTLAIGLPQLRRGSSVMGGTPAKAAKTAPVKPAPAPPAPVPTPLPSEGSPR